MTVCASSCSCARARERVTGGQAGREGDWGAPRAQALYTLPALPPTFGSSAAAQALLAAVRALAPSHPEELSAELSRALAWQLASTYEHAPVRF